MKNPVKYTYYFLTTVTETSLISLLAGMVSGIAISTATSKSITPDELLAGTYLFIAVIGLVILNTIRQNIDKDYNLLLDLPISKKQKWQSATAFNNKTRVIIFFISFIASVGCTAKGIQLIRLSNAKQNKQEEMRIAEQANKKKADSITMRALINYTDSLLHAIKHPNIYDNNKPVKQKI